MSSQPKTVMWFRKDLRLRDNPALTQATKVGSVVAVYTLCEQQWDIHRVALCQRQFIASQLKHLAQDLAKLNIPLVILNPGTFKQVPDMLLSYLHEVKCSNLLFNEEYELNERNLTEKVTELAHSNKINMYSYHDQCLISPGQILNKQGEPYKVFTAFKKSYIANLSTLMRPILGLPKAHKDQGAITNTSCLKAIETDILTKLSVNNIYIQAGESNAHQQLKEFSDDAILNYKLDRDIPAINGTSYLSTYLAVGLLSVRQCYQSAQQVRQKNVKLDLEGVDTWISELIWRDFYRHLLFLYPNLCKHEAFKPKTDYLSWSHDSDLFNAWCQGQTGFPIVDAAMRQLNTTGWMHNRLRMIVAMFLTKHLFIDWRWGEVYFMSRLLDGDFASNNGGWQWSASTGVDSAPYFRIFNPTRQSERFDSMGLFIRIYVPELASLDNKSIHMPTAQQAKQLGYPMPIVEHSFAVAETKNHFKSLDQKIESGNASPLTKYTQLHVSAMYSGDIL
jgi:deoxyribodipyrimidine photo-lyase